MSLVTERPITRDQDEPSVIIEPSALRGFFNRLRGVAQRAGSEQAYLRQAAADVQGPASAARFLGVEGARSIARPSHRLLDAMSETLEGIKQRYGTVAAQNVAGSNALTSLIQLQPSLGFVNDFDQFAAEYRSGVLEVVRWMLYSYRAYAAAGQVQTIHFQDTISSATNRQADTNMQLAGQMSGGEAFLVGSIRVIPIPAFADIMVANGPALGVSDWYKALYVLSYLQFNIQDKIYAFAGPLIMFPQASGFGTVATASAAAATTNNLGIPNNGHSSNMAMWKQEPPVLVLPTRSFITTLNWTTVQTVTTAGRIGVAKDGLRVRVVQ